MSKRQAIDGVRLKIRSDAEWVTATVWIGDEPQRELARLWLPLADEPGGERFQAWLSAVEAMFNHLNSQATGHEISSLRRAPDYRGERP